MEKTKIWVRLLATLPQWFLNVAPRLSVEMVLLKPWNVSNEFLLVFKKRAKTGLILFLQKASNICTNIMSLVEVGNLFEWSSYSYLLAKMHFWVKSTLSYPITCQMVQNKELNFLKLNSALQLSPDYDFSMRKRTLSGNIAIGVFVFAGLLVVTAFFSGSWLVSDYRITGLWRLI